MGASPEVDRLIRSRPRSHQAGTFPRAYLPPGEAALFETRPYFWQFISPRVAGGLIAIAYGYLLGVLGPTIDRATGATFGPLWPVLGFILGVFGVAVVVAAILEWYNTSYVCTNRRIALKSGVFGRTIVDARFDKIQCVTTTQTSGARLVGFGTILFQLSLAPMHSTLSGVRHGGILWRAVPEPVAVKAFIEDVADTFAKLSRDGQPVTLEEG